MKTITSVFKDNGLDWGEWIDFPGNWYGEADFGELMGLFCVELEIDFFEVDSWKSSWSRYGEV